MTINSVSFLGQNSYIRGTSPKKTKRHSKTNSNIKLLENQKREFKMYNLNEKEPVREYIPYLDDDLDGEFTFIDLYEPEELKKPQNNYKKNNHKKHKKRHKAYSTKVLIGTTAVSSLLSAGAAALYLNCTQPSAAPKGLEPIPIETITIEQIMDEKHAEPDLVEICDNAESLSLEENKEDSLKTLYNGAFDFELTLDDEVAKGLRKFIKIWNNADKRQKYVRVGNALGIPPEIIAVNHYRESGGNFDCSQVDGTLLEDTEFSSWEESAIHAYTERGLNTRVIDSNDINTWLKFLETYNGRGYEKANINTPYVWSGTEYYTSGKYCSNGKYKANVVDKQPGCAIMLREIFIGDVLESYDNILESACND